MLELVGQVAHPAVELLAELVFRVGGHLAEHVAGPVDQAVEDAVVDGLRDPPRGLAVVAGAQRLPVLLEEAVEDAPGVRAMGAPTLDREIYALAGSGHAGAACARVNRGPCEMRSW